MAEGRVVAIRVSDADFEVLNGLKKEMGISWNELLLKPVEQAYNVTLQAARKGIAQEEEKATSKPKAKKAQVEPAAEEGGCVLPPPPEHVPGE